MDNMNKPDNNKENPVSTARRKFSITGLFYNNKFVLAFSLVVAILAWLFMSTANTNTQTSKTIADIPIELEFSDDALNNHLRAFNMTHDSADVTVTGNSLIINRLTAADFKVVGSYSPDSSKISSTGLRKEVVALKAQKAAGELADYDITAISPEEITIEVDRYMEVTLPIESEITYTSESGFSAGEPVLSDTSLTISGPESSVNKISRVAAAYVIEAPIRDEQRFSASLKLYDQDGAEIRDYAGMYISLSTETVEVVIPVYTKKTVPLEANVINAPEGFADSRIKITPQTIDIAGTEEDLAAVEKITLDEAVDFSEVTAENQSFDMSITIPSGVRNLSTVETATVDVDLSGFKAASVTTRTIKIINVPAGINVEAITQSVTINIMGSEAQIAKLTGENVYCTLDMTGKGDLMGDVELPVSVMISGANSCWAVGKYTINVSITEPVVTANYSIESSMEISGIDPN